VDKFLPTETGEPPLGRADKWAWDKPNGRVVESSRIDNQTIFPLELNTMPGFAGSSAYYLRYMDPHNRKGLVSETANRYWRNVDLYLGGTEHATGHLIYSRFWNKFLFDTGIVCEDEPFRKLINQGMIQGRSNFVYRINGSNTFVSLNLKEGYEVTPLHVDVNIVSNDLLDIDAFRRWNPEYRDAEFILEDGGRYVCGWAVEKMSKSMFNVVNPDVIVEKFGADTLRLYEMFLGPLEQSKPWDTNGIDGVHRFLKKLWALFYGHAGDALQLSGGEPSAAELKTLHKLIKKVSYDIEHFSFNTSVSAFMICVNELTSLKCGKRVILEPLIIVLAPFAPHVAEELWHALGNESTVCDAAWPAYDEAYLKEDVLTYAVSFNGKTRFNIELPAEATREEVERAALAHENAAKWTEGKTPKKVIVVPGKIINIVI
jgi:leucyl-tRNA synthetase